MSLKDQVVVVAGGGSGIGAAIAQSLAAEGCRVAIGGRRLEPLQEVAAGVQAEHPMRVHTLDVADDASIENFFAWATAELGPIDIFVNSAGTNIPNRTMAAMRPEQWDEVMRINATGAYRCMHQVLPSMRERRRGIVVNISSIAGKRASALGGIAYCASKFAMSALSIATANEVKQEGVRVTNVYPGEVNTPILDRRPVPVSDAHREAILQPEDVAAVVLTICKLPPRAHVPEVVVKPTHQEWL